MAFSALSMLSLINQPESVGLVSYVQDKKPAVNKKATKGSGNDTTKDLLVNPFIWLISLSYMIVFLTKSCVGDWGVFFLKDELKFDALKATSFMSELCLTRLIQRT